MADYLHHHGQFEQLIRIVADEQKIDPYLVEKDYWIMHVLYGLKELHYDFELKGGTSLSKAYKIIDRFSEDIDIHIKPPAELGVNENVKNSKPATIERRKFFYDWLAENIKIDGIIKVIRDVDFDDKQYRSGGVRLFYHSYTALLEGVKEGVLLEAGFDQVTPNEKITISSWIFDKGYSVLGDGIIDNRAKDIACYHPGYTFVEKLQTIATKFRNEMEGKTQEPNFMRQYYDVAALLNDPPVIDFIGSEEYLAHKENRFPPADFAIPIKSNDAFTLRDPEIRKSYEKRYLASKNLYYRGQPSFQSLLDKIAVHINKL